MSTVAAASCDAKGAGEAREEKKPLKPCCACPETKKARDACKNSITRQMRVDETGDPCSAERWNSRDRKRSASQSEGESEPLLRIIEKGEENCGHLIEAHKECMRALGFKI